MKLLFIRDYMDYGGASKMIAAVASAMADRGHTCFLYAYASETCPLPLPDGVTLIPGKPFLKNRALRHAAKIGEIRRVLRSVDPDLIVTFLPYPSILTILAKCGLHKKIVISERGDPAVYGGFIRLIGHRILARADGAVFQTEGARDFYTCRLHEKSVVIPNAVTLRKVERLPWEKRKDEIAFVGRFFNRQKRQDIMVEAFALLSANHPDLSLVFYGDGEDIDMIRALVREKGLDSRVRFAGSVAPIEPHLRTARMFVLTSDYEGIPNALIEAMCVGLPCVAADCTPGGARLLIRDGENGLLVPRGDAAAVAAACEKLLADPKKAEIMGEKAQQIIDTFSPEAVYPQWEEYLKQIAGQG